MILFVSWISPAVPYGVGVNQNIDPEIRSAGHSRRVPAEWELQEAIWLQWPGLWEKIYEKAFGKFGCVVLQYENLHILYQSPRILLEARATLEATGCNPDHERITWHSVPNDNAWMRDNGPIFVEEDGSLFIQDWGFDAWGGGFGQDIAYDQDDNVPKGVARYLGLPLEEVDIVHERGNLEFNGVDAVLLNWSALGDPRRNPGYTREKAVEDLKHWFGVAKVVFIEGVPEGDRTSGHIDGIARFIDSDTVVVAQCTENSLCKPDDNSTGSVFEAAALTLRNAGFKVIREPIEGFVEFEDLRFDTNYMNWLVGNGFVITTGFGNRDLDKRAQERLQQYFPNRDVYVLEMLESWAAGGGVHCHTNDQPLLLQSSK